MLLGPVMDPDEPILEVCRTETRLRINQLDHFKLNKIRQQSFRVHRNTKSILLRFRREINIAQRSHPLEFVDYPLMESYCGEINSYLSELRRFYEFKDFCVLIASLKGCCGAISMHKDQGPYFEASRRIHIPIKTNKAAVFRIGGISLNMKEDIAYEIANTRFNHGAINKGDEDRHHIIFDLFSTQYSKEPSNTMFSE